MAIDVRDGDKLVFEGPDGRKTTFIANSRLPHGTWVVPITLPLPTWEYGFKGEIYVKEP